MIPLEGSNSQEKRWVLSDHAGKQAERQKKKEVISSKVASTVTENAVVGPSERRPVSVGLGHVLWGGRDVTDSSSGPALYGNRRKGGCS
jgi:hypothetical protein